MSQEVIGTAKVHWIVFFTGAAALIAAAFLLLVHGESEAEGLYKLIGIPLLAFAIVKLVKAVIARFGTVVVLTSSGISVRKGILAHRHLQMQYKQIARFRVHQSLLGRILSYGEVVMTSTGGAVITLPFIADPTRLASLLDIQLHHPVA